jgi:hypothetical protein
MRRILLLLLTIIVTSCSNGIDGEIIHRDINVKDFGMTEDGKFFNEKGKFIGRSMTTSELKDKYSRDILKQYDWHTMLGCTAYIPLSESNQIILKNTSLNKKLKYTINTTRKTYDTQRDSLNCFKPIMENPKIEYDTDYETLNPGELELIGTDRGYLKGNYFEIEYELSGALEVK